MIFADDRSIESFSISPETMVPTTENNRIVGDNLNGGFGLLNPLPRIVRVKAVSVDELLRRAASQKIKHINSLKALIYTKPSRSNSDVVTNWGNSYFTDKKRKTLESNPYYKLANSRQINQTHQFRSKQLRY